MSDRRRLVFSILKFCSAEMQSNQLSDDAKESLEVRFIFKNLLAFYIRDIRFIKTFNYIFFIAQIHVFLELWV